MKQKSAITDYIRHIDTKTLLPVLALCIFGLFIMFSVSPATAYRIHIGKFQIAIKHTIFLGLSLIVMIRISCLQEDSIIKGCIIMYFVLILMLAMVLLVGPDIKGSKRWIRVPFITNIQPSEILKPFFVVTNAMFLRNVKHKTVFKITVSLTGFLIIAGLLIKEPDFGMFCIYGAVWMIQLFVAGTPPRYLVGISLSLTTLAIALISILPHAKQRLVSFMDRGSEIGYQADKALQSMVAGRDFGKGPGDGTIKFQLPDVYTDYIFAAIGEEFGYVMCFVVMCLYAFIAIHNLLIAKMEPDAMKANIITGFIAIFALQAFINIGVNIGLLPSKGMTMPFISYGGSAMLGMSIGFGILMSITGRNGSNHSRYNLYT